VDGTSHRGARLLGGRPERQLAAARDTDPEDHAGGRRSARAGPGGARPRGGRRSHHLTASRQRCPPDRSSAPIAGGMALTPAQGQVTPAAPAETPAPAAGEEQGRGADIAPDEANELLCGVDDLTAAYAAAAFGSQDLEEDQRRR